VSALSLVDLGDPEVLGITLIVFGALGLLLYMLRAIARARGVRGPS
jgi:hypothetical protein